jgi:hypothetical protein
VPVMVLAWAEADSMASAARVVSSLRVMVHS